MAVKRKGGLGKGLDSLIPSHKPDTNENTNMHEKVVEKIVEVPVRKSRGKNSGSSGEKVVEKVVEKSAEVMVKVDEIEPNQMQPRKISTKMLCTNWPNQLNSWCNTAFNSSKGKFILSDYRRRKTMESRADCRID